MTNWLYIFSSLSLAILCFAVITNILRKNASPNFELEPNCLLTRYPILFLSGNRSIFYFFSYWNSIPLLLAEHGYEVYKLALPWKSSKLRIELIKNYLQKAETNKIQYHLFFDESILNEIEDLLKHQDFESIASLNCVTDKTQLETSKKSYKSMPIPIQICTVKNIKNSNNLHTHIFKLNYILHQFFTGNKVPSYIVGISNTNKISFKDTPYQILAHARHLAEQDLRRG